MHCQSCGKQTPDGSTFCLHCGARIDRSSVRPATDQTVGETPAATSELITSRDVERHKRQEPYHWKAAISTVACLIVGLVIMGSGGSSETAGLAIIGGLTLIGLAVAAFVITEGWRYADDLPTGKKIIAYLPAVAGGFAAFAVIGIVWIAWQALKEIVEEL